MSMGNKVPEIRFKGFCDSWKMIQLGSTAKIKGRLGWKSLKQEEYVSSGPAMIAGKHIKNGVIDWNEVDHIPNWRYLESPEIMLRINDIIFSKDGSLGNPAVVSNLDVEATINSTMMLVRPHEYLNSKYFYQILNTRYFKDLIKEKVSGSSIPHLFQADMKLFTFPVATPEEQTAIGNTFQKLDNLINQHQQKHDKLSNIKKAMLEKMFPKQGETIPEIRFKGFSGEWEEKELRQIATYRNGKAHEQSIAANGSYIVVNSKFVSTNGDVKKYANEQISPLLKNEICFVLSDVPNGKAIARTFLIAEDNLYTLNQRIAGIKPNETSHHYFLYILLNRNPYFLKFDDGAKQTNLSVSDVENFTSPYPSVEEQTAIGNYFQKLDALINQHQEQVIKLNNIKQACLSKMFV